MTASPCLNRKIKFILFGRGGRVKIIVNAEWANKSASLIISIALSEVSCLVPAPERGFISNILGK
jgi:hypothetical protein